MADLIDRDLTIHELEAFRESCIANLLRMSFDDITDVVKGIRAVNRWIPCSERMPENRCGVIFTVDRGHPFVCVGYRLSDERIGWQRWFDKLSGLNFGDHDVKSWMPMPDAWVQPDLNALNHFVSPPIYDRRSTGTYPAMSYTPIQ